VSTLDSRLPSSSALRYRLRVLWVVAVAEFKLKYAGSALGYLWSAIKPLALFTMMYIVFGRLFNLADISPYYPTSLLIGIVLFTFFADATSLGMTSLPERQSLLRKLSFPRVLIPLGATITAGITFLINCGVIAGFLIWQRVTPSWHWLLLPLLLAELYLFSLGIGFALAALFVRFRDFGQIWELLLQLFFYATPIIYPVGYLPAWAREIVFLNPFTQILQDVRRILLPETAMQTVTTAYGSYGRLVPVAIAFAVLGLGFVLFKHEEPWFAERV
jgi:ABC-2 type transport system permease protein